MAKALAQEFAKKLDKAMHPVNVTITKVNIEDTFNKNRKILITLRDPASTDVKKVLEDYLERVRGYPSIEYWDIQQRTGGPAFLGTPFLCHAPDFTQIETIPPSQRARQQEKVKKNIMNNLDSMSLEDQLAFIEKVTGQKKD